MNCQSLVEFLKGKKTYFSVAIALLYIGGSYLGFWECDAKVLGAIGMGALAFLRAGVSKGAVMGMIGVMGLMGSGCTQLVQSNKVFSETSWIVGIRVKMSDPTSSNPLPDVQLGVMRQTFTLIPTGTNQIYAPRFGAAYAGKQNAYDPISTDAQESVFSGDVMVSTNATGGAIVPKLIR